MTEAKLDFEKHADAMKHLQGKSKVKVQILRSLRGVKYDSENPDADPQVVGLRGFREEISGGDTGNPDIPATTGEYVVLATPNEDHTFNQNKRTVAAWALKRGDVPPKIRFVSDKEFADGIKGGSPAPRETSK